VHPRLRNEVFPYEVNGLGDIFHASNRLTEDEGACYAYDALGRIVSETGTLENPYAYTGRERDEESGLYYYRARYYAAEIGRFTTEDPIGFAGGDGNLNRYMFNDPIVFFDPSGLEALVIGDPADSWRASIMRSAAPEIFLNNYSRMRRQNLVGNDKYFYCKAKCESAELGKSSEDMARKLNDFKEWFNREIKGDEIFECNADQGANEFGREQGRRNPGGD
jgi:RHS repeat-associated protein